MCNDNNLHEWQVPPTYYAKVILYLNVFVIFTQFMVAVVKELVFRLDFLYWRSDHINNKSEFSRRWLRKYNEIVSQRFI